MSFVLLTAFLKEMIICLFATFHHSFIYVVDFFNHHSWFGSSFHWGLCLQRKLAVFLVGHCYFWWMKSCDFLKAIAKFTLNLVGQDSPKELKSPKRPLWHKERQWGVAGFWVCTGHLHSTHAVCRLLLLLWGTGLLPSIRSCAWDEKLHSCTLICTMKQVFSPFSERNERLLAYFIGGTFFNACCVDQRQLANSLCSSQHCKIRLSPLVLTALNPSRSFKSRDVQHCSQWAMWGCYFFQLFNNIDQEVMAQKKGNSICGLR